MSKLKVGDKIKYTKHGSVKYTVTEISEDYVTLEGVILGKKDSLQISKSTVSDTMYYLDNEKVKL